MSNYILNVVVIKQFIKLALPSVIFYNHLIIFTFDTLSIA